MKKLSLYQERMQSNSEFEKSLSRAWARLHSNSAVVVALPATKDDAKAFKSFADYLKKRHACTETPARGWSMYYAYQWAEQQIKTAAKGGNKAAELYTKRGRKDLDEIRK